MMRMLFSSQTFPMNSSSSLVKTLPTGLCGVFRIRALVLGVMAFWNSSGSSFHSEAPTVSLPALGGGRRGTKVGTPPQKVTLRISAALVSGAHRHGTQT